MSLQTANFAADLRRISYFIYNGRIKLARQMIGNCRRKYRDVNRKIGCYEDIWEEIGKIEKLVGGKNKAAERASTASVILLHNS